MAEPTTFNATAPSPAFVRRFRDRAGPDAVLRFDEFMDIALYDEEVGYYRRSQRRVGYGGGTDFYTASTSGPIFGELICAACAALLPGKNLADFRFVEIGAEPGSGVLQNVPRAPFRAAEAVRLGDPLQLAGNCIVFSNELFDAQPFRRVVWQGGQWRERTVTLSPSGELHETLLDPVSALIASLPAVAPEGYALDLPLRAVDLARQIADQAWTGLFLAFDYGKRWAELIESQAAGTARAYFQHTQSNDLLARPGEQDLTCHVCWDWLEAALHDGGFPSTTLESQEAFFVHHAGSFIAQAIAAEAARASQRKLALMQLLHPAHLGQKFQVLHATRLAPCAPRSAEAS